MEERSIAQYRLLEKLGSGGMGEVYLAEDVRVGHRVAIKLLPRWMADDRAARGRFLREAKAVASLDHPSILPLHEFDEADGEVYIVTAYMAGGSLRDELERNSETRIEVETALRWGTQAAEGLAVAHESGIVHRDIKPDNLLLSESGDLRIADFGLASIADVTRITHSGATMGTLGYMSPEQVRGQEVDHRTDLFSLGATLYEVLSGSRPFGGSDQAAVLHAVAYEEPASLDQLREDLPPELGPLVHSLLAKDPQGRPASAAEVAIGLRHVASALGIEETEVLPRSQPIRKPGRTALPRPVIGALVLVVAVGLGWWVLREPPPPPPPPDPDEPVVTFAVLPFSVDGGEQVSSLAAGMSELLSSRLHGAGSLRRAGQSSGIWPADLERARELAEERDVSFLVRGNVVEAAERIHVRAELLSRESGADPIVSVRVEGSTGELPEMLDELSRRVLLAYVDATGELPHDVESVKTESLEALRFFLQGEWWAAQGTNSEAAQAFERAVEVDPDFALAWFRLACVILPPAQSYDRAREAIERASANAEQLTENTRMHLEVIEAFIDGDAARVEEVCRALISVDPEDVEAWRWLEAGQFLIGWKNGRRISSARPALERLREFGHPNQWHEGWIGIWEKGLEAPADRVPKDIADATRLPVRTAVAGVQGDEASLDSLLSEWSQLGSEGFLRDFMGFEIARTAPKAAERVAALLTRDPRTLEIQALGHVLVANLRAQRGRWQDARSAFAAAREKNFALAIEHEALLAASPFMPVSQGELRRLRDDLLEWNAKEVTPGADPTRWVRVHDDCHPHLRLYLLGLMSARLGEFEAARNHADALEQLSGGERVKHLAADLAHGVRARALWEDEQAEQALAELEQASFRSSPDDYWYSPFYTQSQERYLRAETLWELGRGEEALGWYPNPFQWGMENVYLGPYHLRHGQILADLGQTDLALQHYDRFFEYWSECEPQLLPVVETARAEVERIRESMTINAEG